jgi:hypothetical protein
MIIAALAVGLIAAYYLGFRVGIYAAAITAGLLLAAKVIPGSTIPVYLLIGGGLAAVHVIGKRRPRPTPLMWAVLTLGKARQKINAVLGAKKPPKPPR